MRYLIVVVSLIGLISAAPVTVHKNIKIERPWVHATNGSRAVLHITIANTHGKADRLVRVSTPVAAKVAIFDQVGAEGGGLQIPGRAEFVLGSDFPRIELNELTKTLQASTSFDLLLVFDQAGKVGISVLVEAE